MSDCSDRPAVEPVTRACAACGERGSEASAVPCTSTSLRVNRRWQRRRSRSARRSKRSTVRSTRVRSRKHGEKLAPVAAALTGLATLACCLPVGFAADAVTAGLSPVLTAYQSWFLGASVVLLAVGLVQLNQVQRTCSRRPYGSFIVFGGTDSPRARLQLGSLRLATLDSTSLQALQTDFNRESSHARVIVLLSPT
jgi:hypothetical protein